MGLGWKDAIATTLVGTGVALGYAKVQEVQWFMLTTWRLPSLIVLGLGLASCIVIGSGTELHKDGWTTFASILGASMFILALANLIINSGMLFALLLGVMVVLWAATTVRHLLDHADSHIGAGIGQPKPLH